MADQKVFFSSGITFEMPLSVVKIIRYPSTTDLCMEIERRSLFFCCTDAKVGGARGVQREVGTRVFA